MGIQRNFGWLVCWLDLRHVITLLDYFMLKSVLQSCSPILYSSIIVLHNYFKQIKCLVPNRTIWPIDRTLAGTTTPNQSGPVIYDLKEVTPLSAEFKNWIFTVGFSLMLFILRKPFFKISFLLNSLHLFHL